MKTFYVEVELQCQQVVVIKVEAENELEAKGKAFEVFASCVLDVSYDISVSTDAPEETPELYLDEDGGEIDEDEEEDEKENKTMDCHYYYYGNSVVEALINGPVEIKSTKVLKQYEECYSVVIPADEVEEEIEEEKDDE